MRRTENVHFLCLEPHETHKNVLKLSWNFLKIGSWNFTSCSWEPCEYCLKENVNLTKLICEILWKLFYWILPTFHYIAQAAAISDAVNMTWWRNCRSVTADSLYDWTTVRDVTELANIRIHRMRISCAKSVGCRCGFVAQSKLLAIVGFVATVIQVIQLSYLKLSSWKTTALNSYLLFTKIILELDRNKNCESNAIGF